MFDGPIQREAIKSVKDFGLATQLVQELNIRFVGVRDQFSEFRLQWLGSVFRNVEVYDFNSQETYAVSTAQSDFDVIIVGANDAVRIAKFARSNTAALTRRAIFALMDQTDPPRRARILCAGFDDVFDLSRTAPEEAMIRVAAVWRRYQLVGEAEKLHADRMATMAAVTNGSELGRREVLLLQALCDKINRPVSYQTLINLCSQDYEAITFEHLKVLMSNLRKKLNSMYKITAVHGQGYLLSKQV